MHAKSLFRFQFENEALLGRQADQDRFKVLRQLTAAHLQRGRAHVKGRQEFLAIQRRDAVMQGQIAVGTNGCAHGVSFLFTAAVYCPKTSKTAPTVIAESAILKAGQ